MKMFLLFSHSLTDEQKKDAIENLKVTKFISLPEQLQKLWSNIPPEIDSLGEYLNDIKSLENYSLTIGAIHKDLANLNLVRLYLAENNYKKAEETAKLIEAPNLAQIAD